MSARDDILRALRGASLAPEPLPPLAGEWTRYADPIEQFRAALEEAAGRLEIVPEGAALERTEGAALERTEGAALERTAGAALERTVGKLEGVRRARHCRSLVAGLGDARPLPPSAHELARLDALIVGAQFGVAENGAVWLDERAARATAACFLCEHLVVVLSRSELVNNLHEAYARLGAEFAAYGAFVAGPSKTADIEQSLVIGAHGPRALTVVLY